jgi:chromosome segregation ATPase
MTKSPSKSSKKRSPAQRQNAMNLGASRHRKLGTENNLGDENSTLTQDMEPCNQISVLDMSATLHEVKNTLHNVVRCEKRSRDKNQDLESQLKVAKAEQQQSRQVTQELEQCLDFAVSEIKDLQHQVDQQSREISSLSGRLEEAENTLFELKTQGLLDQRTIDGLMLTRNELKRKMASLRKNAGRVPHQKARLMQKAIRKMTKRSVTEKMKKGNTIREHWRAVCRGLITEDKVAAKHVNSVIHRVSDALGVNVVDKISPRAARRAVLEGGIHAQIQLATELAQSTSEYLKT